LILFIYILQFSHDTVKRYEQVDLRHQEKRRELETRLGKFCAITKTFIDNQNLFIEVKYRINELFFK
jgi:hypothetical protein